MTNQDTCKLVLGISILTLMSILGLPAEARLDQQLCQRKGEYAVFARHGILGGNSGQSGSPADKLNIQRAHEHIFFCKNQRIVDNAGFGVGKPIVGSVYAEGIRFSYSPAEISRGVESNGGKIDDYVLVSAQRYNSTVIKEIIGFLPSSCVLQNDGNYSGIGNNCQDWTDRVRREYLKKRANPEIVDISCSNCTSNSGSPLDFVFSYRDINDDAERWEISHQSNPKKPVFQGTLEGCNSPNNDSCGGLGSPKSSYTVKGMGGNCKQNNRQACIHPLQLTLIDKAGNRSISKPFILRINSQ